LSFQQEISQSNVPLMYVHITFTICRVDSFVYRRESWTRTFSNSYNRYLKDRVYSSLCRFRLRFSIWHSLDTTTNWRQRWRCVMEAWRFQSFPMGSI